jgi:hypothetical protein
MEAILATKDANGYEDGDIVEAFSLNRIRLAHAQTLTSVQRYPLDEVSGLRVPGTPLDKLLAVTHKYKYIINQAGILKVHLVTDDSVELDTDFTEFLARRRENPEHMLFGGSEITHWYGERIPDVSGDTAWDTLESCTDYLREDYSTWPLSDLEKRLFLPISMTGKAVTESGTVDVLLSDPTVDEFRSSLIQIDGEGEDETHTVLARRRFNVPYWDLSATLGIQPNIARTQMTDIRTSDDVPHVDSLVSDKEN